MTSFRDAPIKRKLMLIGLLTSGLGLLLISLILAVEGWVEWRERTVSDMVTHARMVGVSAASTLVFDDADAATKILAVLSESPEIVDAMIYDKTGSIFTHYSAAQHAPGTLHPSIKPGSHLFDYDRLVVSEPIRLKSEELGSIYLEADLRELRAAMLDDLALIFISAFGVFLITTLVFGRLQKTIVTPIMELAGGMRKVSVEQDYAVRVAAHSKDEVGVLANTFNNMLERIQQRDNELVLHREHLKEEVAQRTASLAESERHLNFLIGSSPAIIYTSNASGNYAATYISENVRQQIGYAPDQFVDDPDFWISHIHPVDLERVLAGLPHLFEHGYHIHEYRFQFMDGSYHWMLDEAKLVLDEKGNAREVIGYWVDITERKQTELKLQESEERFRKSFQYSAIGMGLVALDGRWLKVNNALCKMIGYAEQELLSKTFQDITHPDDLQADLHVVAQLLAGEMDHYQMEKRYYHKDGHIVWIRLSVALIKDTQGNPIHFVSQIDDITEHKQVEEKIRKLNEELDAKVQERTRQLLDAQEELVRREKLSVLGQVAGSVGHELRNPLGVMSNAVYFLQTVLSDADETTREYLDIIKNEIAAAERIVSDLLDSVRTKPPRPEMVGLAELVDQTLHKLTIPPSVSVKLDIPELLPALRVDAQQIHQVLRNLISNGVEATHDGGTLEIRAVENQADATVSVSVHDSGSGIAPEVLAKLFTPLLTTKARGIGLGLVVVKNLTQANGGTVQVESEVGKGTTFTLTLPC